ncbi:MAG TPA: sigma-70 family RNA polymerase sigma factor [Bryobacteraceae bacterium]|nr:sigma-70 family RNA polymerase sigma factor [Bryobacteraceae bacterium]
MRQSEDFTQLLEQNLVPLNRFVMGMVGNSFDAEDIVQETAVKAFVHFGEFRAESKFKTWLMSIALNEVRSRRRRDFRSRLRFFDFDELEQFARGSSGDSPFRQLQEKEASGMLENALTCLHPSYKEMIQLRVTDGLDIADTARRLDISLPAAKARYHRAVHRLSRTLARKTRKPIQPISGRRRTEPAASEPSRELQAVLAC